MDGEGLDLVERMHREELARIRSEATGQWLEPKDRVSRLPDLAPGSPITDEWDLFRSELQMLLRQGNRGRIALVKIGHPITTWDTLHDALQAARMIFGQEPFFFQEIQPYLKPIRLGA